MSLRPASPSTPQAEGLRGRELLAVFALSLACSAWILRLPLRMDDYLLLQDPWGLFARVPAAQAREGALAPPFMLRWTLWAIWGVIAELAPRPLCALPFLLVGWCVHGLVCVLLGDLVQRLMGTDARALRSPGVWAAVLAAVAGGALQAVGWPAAWGDLFSVFFALLALGAWVRARRGSGWRWLVSGTLCWSLALLTKESAPTLLAAGAALLWVLPDTRARRWWGECAVLALLMLSSCLTRWWYLGSFLPSYAGVHSPGLADLWPATQRGLELLRQALLPFSDDPLLVDLCAAPRWAAPLLWACVLLVGFAALSEQRSRTLTLACLASVLLLVLPAGLLDVAGPPNLLSRTQYAPLLVVCAVLGLGLARLCAGRRLLLLLPPPALALLLVLGLGARAFARAEGTAAAELRELFAALASFEAQGTGHPSRVFLVSASNGFAGSPQLGQVAPLAFAPPFRAAGRPPLEVLPLATAAQAQQELLGRGWPGEDLLVLEQAAVQSGFTGLAAREARRPRVLLAVRANQDAQAARATRVTLEAATTRSLRLHFEPPLARHAAAALLLELEPRAASVRAQLLAIHGEAAQQPAAHALRVVGLEGQSLLGRVRVPLVRVQSELDGAPWPSLELSFEPPLASLPRSAELSFERGALELLEPKAQARLALDPLRVPELQLRASDLLSSAASVLRVELATQLVGGELRLCADLALTPELLDAAAGSGQEAFAVRLERLHLGADLSPAEAAGLALPWSDFLERLLLPAAHAKGLSEVPCKLSVHLLLASGQQAAQSSPRLVFLELGSAH